ncbi:hypothetical protein [Pseudomonas helleri]|uniref:hypothetical protein n=1 Tax=Pseudomonas helleri TaxID=1608996 RepID=UPI0012969C33|nr:hypothetical protein [Pseudomonas helleri]MQT35308.1 hypothetical protein [Pseudomonas helleri]
MIFEKPILKIKSNILDLVGYTAFVFVLSSYLTYGVLVIYGIGGIPPSGKVTVIDWFNGLAQIATASAFILALLQYRKNVKQQRQKIIADEAKVLIGKMVSIAGDIKTGEDTCLDNLNHAMSSLSNVGVGFTELFNSMDEDVERAIVRMQWQDMYYNYLSRALNKLELEPVLRKDDAVGEEELQAARIHAIYMNGIQQPIAAFERFCFFSTILKSSKIAAVYKLRNKLESLDGFVSLYLNTYHTNDLMYGLLSRIDIRAHAPLLAVAEPAEWAFQDLRNKKA